MHGMGSELGVSFSNLNRQYDALKAICVIGCKTKLVFNIYSAHNTDKVLMKKHAVAISNTLQAFEIDPGKVDSIAASPKAIKKFQFNPPKAT